jgi:multidrug resistance protein
MPNQAALLRNRFWVTIAVTLTALMQTLDSTIANVALPHIQGSMGATQDEISWVLTSYILATAIMTPPSAFLANRFGRKRVLVACGIGFIFASALCGAATSLTQIVGFRFLQGAFGAPLMPIIQAVLLDLYTDKERGKSMAIFGFGVMFGPIIGPTLGGLLTDFYNWRWVFYINLPLGALAVGGMIVFMQESARETERSFDFFGFGLLAITVAALQLALDRGQSQNWFSYLRADDFRSVFLFISRTHLYRRTTLRRARHVSRSQFCRWFNFQFFRGVDIDGHDGTDADLFAKPARHSGVDRRYFDGPARCRHSAGHAGYSAPRGDYRSALVVTDWHRGHGAGDGRNGALHARYCQ